MPMLAAVFIAAVTVHAPRATDIRPGTIVERVTCPSDPTQTYALYLPSTYSPDRRWPLLFVFDPRSRGRLAAEIFRPAAERFGWIVASSNNTMSDGDWEPNRRAVAAMWPDVRAAYAIDERRIYAAGFSGGASIAWTMANNGAPLAGIVAVGGPDLPEQSAPPASVAWFGAAGREDFNYLDAKAMEKRFERAGLRLRLAFFDGGHRWLPADLATRAVGWFEALALLDGRRIPDDHLRTSLAADDLAYAEQLHRDGRHGEARHTLDAIVRDYAGTRDANRAGERAAALDRETTFAGALENERREDDRERGRLRGIAEALALLRNDDLPPANVIIRDLQIERLKAVASKPGYAGGSARRSLETIFVQVSFYLWRDFAGRKDWRRAAAALDIAVAIHPDRARLWVDLAGARAQLGDRSGAVRSLRRAADLGYCYRFFRVV